jgi:signal transduction histidine kinase
MHTTLKKKRIWLAGFGVCFGLAALLVTVAWANLKSATDRGDTQRWETHTREVLLTAKDTLSALQDAETGQRGYLLTRHPDYLEPYNRGITQFGEAIEHLAALTENNAGQQARIAELRRVASNEFTELAATVSLAQSGDQAGALALVIAERGKIMMNDARRILQALNAEEDSLLGVRRAASREAAVRDDLMSFGLGAVGAAALLTAVLAIAKALGSLRRFQEAQEARQNLEIRVTQEVEARMVTQARLVQAEKLTTLGQLSGGIAHDFNNILQTVAGVASMIGKHADEPATVRRFGMMLENSAARGSSITRRLLSFAQRGEMRAEAINISALLDGLHEMLTHTLGASYVIRIDAQTGLPPVLADRGQLETVLVNLATNARDAMPSGGTITVSVNLETVPDDRHPAGLLSGTYGRLIIEDTGTGMDRATLARAMEPFFTTKAEGKGTGLGLPMARGFADQAGGALTVVSEPGQGTTVTLWLPVTDTLATPRSEPEYHAPEGRSTLPRILLVDNEALVREVLAEQLGDSGYEVVQADCGEAALALLEVGVRPIDLIVTDLAMPGMNGVELLHAVHVRRPRLPAILLTGYAGNATSLAVSGAVSLLYKPASGPQLTDRIETLLKVLAIS